MTMRDCVGNPLELCSSWAQVLELVKAGAKLYYKGPLQYWPMMVLTRLERNDTVRVAGSNNRFDQGNPHDGGYDPFRADQGHLDRFLKRKGA